MKTKTNTIYMMKLKFIITTFLILLGNQTYSQESIIKGRIIDYETNQSITGVNITDLNNTQNGTLTDFYGNFELKLQGNTGTLKFYHLGFYPIKFLNIPSGYNHIDFGEIKLASNHLMDNMTIGGPPTKISEKQKKQDKRLRKNVLKKYNIKILGEKLTPYFEGESLIFDYNDKGNK
ncbi:carboxypeptidase-like regulatory domain-containing protein [Arenibacter sp. 6A1]|uniref:carboxypeptidase-like regulatory domain-containing protein n=1 Tax=Arenibacter sp. 6A1 TaxID=2720391 RepID=UPI00144830A4|nr:carboxypeptidase-like regulatory domain-containing protein [Arenibacter sp. 6A1]NKI27009.1 carboxypeptidase-like regulatory domain-containing protein [Arenibacter sp. 6A1]